ncbi:ubiquinone anaerobic biosynthesis accessory factor UbiT [Roseibium aggregatum]|uniref:SCP2 sterol-binding domain-containing protein n=1 Tax=Roseibium aggregatum TaxID=187304 RepID=A0A939J6E6_9HYPH|nr:SCP2 sterol-binding domain-containing protein [Roseibium aggregatum]MBN9672719.1 SCP2 sterol-binding domain-containing protein [Roseibium aggregatum]
MQDPVSVLSLPPFVSTLIAPLPRLPMETFLTLLTRRLVARRPDLLRRLGTVVHVPIAIVPEDLPHAFLLSLDAIDSRVTLCGKDEIGDAQAVIRAPLLVLLGLLDGTYDGDAMFFSRDLRIEGKTEYVLALRNTLEEADLTPGEFLGLGAPAAGWINDIGSRVLAQARCLASAGAERRDKLSGRHS